MVFFYAKPLSKYAGAVQAREHSALDSSRAFTCDLNNILQFHGFPAINSELG